MLNTFTVFSRLFLSFGPLLEHGPAVASCNNYPTDARNKVATVDCNTN